jgi:xanthine dehydrogenase iron-sulfur cluster and FAD-binding subunit A
MLSARFEYNRPGTLDEALGLLDEYGENAKVLAGGMSLIPLMKLRFAVPERLVDIGRISGLDGISESDGQLRVGAMTTHGALETSEILSARYPAMSAAAPLVSPEDAVPGRPATAGPARTPPPLGTRSRRRRFAPRSRGRWGRRFGPGPTGRSAPDSGCRC